MRLPQVKSLLLLLFSYAATSFSLDSDKLEVMHISADSADINHSNHVGVYRGHVHLEQGSTTLAADSAETFGNEKNQLVKALIHGSKEKQAEYAVLTDLNKPRLIALADEIQYHPLEHLIVLKGNATVSQGKNRFSAALIRYNILTRHVVSESDGKKRTTITIYPDKKKA